jgi:drug/metabolite transporter (DMT)-like permease
MGAQNIMNGLTLWAILPPVLGILYTLIAAASFGLNNATVRRGVVTGTVSQAVMLSMPIGLAMFAIAAAFGGQLGALDRFTPNHAALIMTAGIVHFVFGRYCNYRSIQAMGSNLSAPIQQWTLLVTLTLAVLFLHETLDLLKISGIALLVAGPAMVVGAQKSRRRRTRAAPAATAKSAGAAAAPTTFQPKMAEGYVYGILSCLAYGTSPILVRAGLEGTGMALAGGVISYGAATVLVLIGLLWRPIRRDAVGIDRTNVPWFIWTGVTVCLSQIFLYLAMAIAPVTVVQPLMRFSTVFRTGFAWLFNREQESFDPSLLLAIAISTVGALALAFDGATVARWVGAPSWLSAILSWRWST